MVKNILQKLVVCGIRRHAIIDEYSLKFSGLFEKNDKILSINEYFNFFFLKPQGGDVRAMKLK